MSNQKKENKTGEIWVKKFTEDAATKFREEVMERAMKDPNVPIIIYVDSYGGQVDALAKMVGTLQQIGNPIITYCLGKAMSCGAILLSFGDYRYCDPLSRVMVHEVSTGTWGDVHDVKNDAEEGKRLNKLWMNLLAKNCGIKGGYQALRDKIKRHDGRELWMSAEDALAFGIVDEVGVPHIIPHIGFELSTVTPQTRKQRQQRMSKIFGWE